MFLRLIVITSILVFSGPAARADLAIDTQNNSALMPDTHSSLPGKAADTVTLEANIVQIILNDEHRGGVDWGAIVSDFHTVPLKNENDPLWNDKKYRLDFGTLSEDDYTVLLDALDMAGQMSQFPQPPVKVNSNTAAGISFEKQNIHMDFQLARLKTGELSLAIVPHYAIPAMELFNGEKVPSSVSLQAESKELITNNMTIVIGGFMEEEEIKRKHKFPILGNIPLLADIPIVGLVFHQKGRLMQKTETVIFLTVRTNAVETPADD